MAALRKIFAFPAVPRCTFFILVVVVAAGLSGVSGQCNAQGKSVSVEGFMMDNYCITQGTLVDNSSAITLKNPEVHTLECLVEVKSCVASGYTILAEPKTAGGNYSVMYKLDEPGNKVAIAAATKAKAGGQVKGYRLNVTGIDDGTNMLKCLALVGASATPSSTPSSPNSTTSATPSSTPSSPNSATDIRSSLMGLATFAIFSLLASRLMV